MLDDGLDFPAAPSQDSPIPGRILDIGRQNGCLETSIAMKLHKCFKRSRRDERHVAGHDEHVTGITRKTLATGQNSMTGAELFLLLDEFHRRNGGLHLIARMTDDHKNV